MKKISIGSAVFVLVLLNGAALDDITTGNEPSFAEEYAVVALSVLLAAAVVSASLWRRYRSRDA